MNRHEGSYCFNPECNYIGNSQTFNLMQITNQLDQIKTPEELLYNLSLKNRESGYEPTDAEKVFGITDKTGLGSIVNENIVDNFCHILSNIICRERENQDKLFLYHGTSPKSFILTMVYTLYFHELMKTPENRYYLRSDYSKCIEMPTGLDIDPEVQKCLMSTNVSPLANIWTRGESTLSFFLKGIQVADWELEDLLESFYKELYESLYLDLKGKTSKELEKLETSKNNAISSFLELEEILDCTQTGALLQIGINEEVFDDITKLTTSYGAITKLGGYFDEKPSNFLRTLKDNPEGIIPYITEAEQGISGVDSFYNKRYPQYRLFLKEGIIDGDKVIIYPYVIRTNRPAFPCSEELNSKVTSYIKTDNKIKWIADTASKIINDHLIELDLK